MLPYTKHTWKLGEVITPQKLNEISDALEAFTTLIHNATSGMPDLGDNDLNKLNRRFEMLAAQVQWNTLDGIRDIVREFTQEAVSYAESQTLEPAQQALARSNIGAAAASEVVTYRDLINNTPYTGDLELSVKQGNARRNIDAVGTTEFQNAIAGIVKYTDQTSLPWLIDSVQAIARNNIGAVSEALATQIVQASIDSAMETINNKIGNALYVKYTQNQNLSDDAKRYARENINALIAGTANTLIDNAITSMKVNAQESIPKLQITRPDGTAIKSIDLPVGLTFKTGQCIKDNDTGDIYLHLYNALGTELDSSIYTPIKLEGVGGGLAFDSGRCEKRTVVDPVTNEERDAYYIVLTKGENGTPIEGFTPFEIVGGGGGGGLVSGAGFTIKDKSVLTSVGVGQDAIVSVKIAAKGEEVFTIGRWYVNNIWISAADQTGAYYTVPETYINPNTNEETTRWVTGYNTFSFNAKNYLVANKTNRIKLVLSGDDNSSRTLTWDVFVTEVKIVWSGLKEIELYTSKTQQDFILPIQVIAPINQYQIITTGSHVTTTYNIPTIDVNKTYTDNMLTNVTIPASCFSNRFGKHVIKAKLVQKDDPNIFSEEISLVILNESVSTPAIVLFTEQEKGLVQYETMTVSYYIYDDSTSTADVNISLSYINPLTTGLDEIINQTENKHTGEIYQFKYTFYSPHTDGVTFRVSYGSLFDEVTFPVTESEKNLAYIAGAVYSADPRGWSNNANNRNLFAKDGDNLARFTSFAPNNNSNNNDDGTFDWINGGFKEDILTTINNNGETVTIYNDGPAFIIKRGSKLILPRSLFADNDGSGKTIDICFKVKNSADYDSLAFNNVSNNRGLKIYANKAEIYTGIQTPTTVYYTEEERIELSINVESSGVSGRVATIWTDGIPSGVAEYDAGQLTQTGEAVFGSQLCDIYIYNIRVYNTSLTRSQMLQNFYANGPTAVEKLARLNRNVGLLVNNSIDLDSLINKDMLTVIEIQAAEMPPDKHTPKPCKVFIHDPGVELAFILDDANTKFVVQGTSSAAYGQSAFNLDIDFRKHAESKKYQISKFSQPVNYLNIKTNVASSENANNVCCVDWYNLWQPFTTEAKSKSKNDDGTYKLGQAVRDTIEGKPCVVFITNSGNETFWIGSEKIAPGETKFYAAGDLCNSKKNKEVFGQKYPKGISKPTRACIEIGGNDSILLRMLLTSDIYTTLSTYNSVFNRLPWSLNPEHDVEDEGDKGWGHHTSTNPQLDEVYYDYEWRMDPKDIDGSTVDKEDIENFWFDAMTWVGSLADGELIYVLKYLLDGQTYQQEFTDPNNRPSAPNGATNVTYAYGYRLNKYNFALPENFELKTEEEIDALSSIEKQQYNRDKALYDNGMAFINAEKPNLKKYFQLDSLLYHFLMIEMFAAYDDVSKNTFYSLDFDNTQFNMPGENNSQKLNPLNDPMNMLGYRWNIKAAYDWDTTLGCDNDGKLLGGVGIDFGLTNELNASYFNASDNPLWNFIKVAYVQELIKEYGICASAFDGQKLINKWETYQAHRPEAVMITDAFKKYIQPYKVVLLVQVGNNKLQATTKYLGRLQGNKRLHRNQFLTYQSLYMQGKYGASVNSGGIEFRTYDENSSRILTPTFTVSPYITTYISMVKDSTPLFRRKVKKNEVVLATIKFETRDATVYTRPAQLLRYCEPFGGLNARTLNAAGANKLLRLRFEETLENPNLRWTRTEKLAFQSPVLKEIYLTNLKEFGQSLNLIQHQSEALTTLKTVGTHCQIITTVPYSPITTMDLNKCTGLYMEENKQVNHFVIDSSEILETGHNGITEISIINCNDTVTNGILDYLVESLKMPLPTNEYRHIKLIGINWDLNTIREETPTDILNLIYDQKGFDVNGNPDNNVLSELTGTIHINGTFLSTDKEKFRQRWPKLTINVDPDNLISVYTVNVIHNATQEILLTLPTNSGTVISKNELEENLIAIGRKNYSTPTIIYQFNGFTGFGLNSDSIIINQDTNFYVLYQETTRKYTVTWYKNETETDDSIMASISVEYGTDADFSTLTWTDAATGMVYTNQLPLPSLINGVYYLFDGWDKSTGYITQDTKVHAQWITSSTSWSRNDKIFTIGTGINSTNKTIDQFNAADFYALSDMLPSRQQELMVNYQDDHIEDKILIEELPFTIGYLYNYANTYELLVTKDTPYTLSSNQEPIILEKIINLSQPFTLMFEFNMLNTLTNAQTVFSCVTSNHTTVFALRRSSDASTFSFFCQSASATYSEGGTSIRRFVIANKPFERKLDIYWWDNGRSLYADNIVQKHTLSYTDAIQNTNLTFILGREYSPTITTQWLYNTASVTFHEIKYWNITLGKTECLNLTLIPALQIPLIYNGYKKHLYYENGNISYYSAFSFGLGQAIGYSRSLNVSNFENKLQQFSNYYKKLVSPAWQVIAVPINDYYLYNEKTESNTNGKIKPSLLFYNPMWSQLYTMLYPDYSNTSVLSRYTRQLRANAITQLQFGFDWSGRMIQLPSSTNSHTVTTAWMENNAIRTGDVIRCGGGGDYAFYISEEDYNKVTTEPFRDRFSKTADSITISGSGYLADAYQVGLHSIINGDNSSSTGTPFYSLIYTNKEIKVPDYDRVYVVYEGGYSTLVNSSSNPTYTVGLIFCFSVGRVYLNEVTG